MALLRKLGEHKRVVTLASWMRFFLGWFLIALAECRNPSESLNWLAA